MVLLLEITDHAKAFTVGKDNVFGKGEYRPGTKDGDHLLRREVRSKNGFRRQHRNGK
jgi:hypothetical protein